METMLVIGFTCFTVGSLFGFIMAAVIYKSQLIDK